MTIVKYQIGEMFVYTTVEKANDLISEAKDSLKDEIADLDSQMQIHKGILSDLKVKLYAKFGSNINLEAEED